MNEENIRPWGRYDVLDTGGKYQVKRIIVEPLQRLSYQSHKQRSEYWVVVSGTAEITLDGQVNVYTVGDTVFIPISVKHRVKNPGTDKLIFIEVQLGDYLGEDDIERFDDDYGRIG